MYYNKELFVNEEIKNKYKRAEKLQNVLLLSVVLSLIAVFLACLIPLEIVYQDNFMTGYAMAVFATVLLAACFFILFLFWKKFDSMRFNQVNEMKGQPICDKYAELLKFGQTLVKKTNYIVFGCAVLNIAVVWTFAYIFPYSPFVANICVIFAGICFIIRATKNKSIRKIKTMEEEIAQEVRR